MNVIFHLDNTSMSYGPFCSSGFHVRAWVCNQNPILNGWLETQVTGQFRSIQIFSIYRYNWYVFSTKIDIGPARWWLRITDTHILCIITHWRRAHVGGRGGGRKILNPICRWNAARSTNFKKSKDCHDGSLCACLLSILHHVQIKREIANIKSRRVWSSASKVTLWWLLSYSS